jgi:hypothetical protein
MTYQVQLQGECPKAKWYVAGIISSPQAVTTPDLDHVLTTRLDNEGSTFYEGTIKPDAPGVVEIIPHLRASPIGVNLTAGSVKRFDLPAFEVEASDKAPIRDAYDITTLAITIVGLIVAFREKVRGGNAVTIDGSKVTERESDPQATNDHLNRRTEAPTQKRAQLPQSQATSHPVTAVQGPPSSPTSKPAAEQKKGPRKLIAQDSMHDILQTGAIADMADLMGFPQTHDIPEGAPQYIKDLEQFLRMARLRRKTSQQAILTEYEEKYGDIVRHVSAEFSIRSPHNAIPDIARAIEEGPQNISELHAILNYLIEIER